MAYESRFESFASFSANAGERKPRSPAAWDADLRRRDLAPGARPALSAGPSRPRVASSPVDSSQVAQQNAEL